MKISGLVHAEILPPQDLLIPFLPIRLDDGIFYALCFTCAQKRKEKKCICPDKKRKFTSTYCSSEINKARELGYKVRLLEIYNYNQEEKIFAHFVRELAFLKLKYSGYPLSCVTDDEKTKYLLNLNRQMGFVVPNLLTLNNVSNDLGKRQFFKDCLNHFCGKWSQGSTSEKTATVFVSTYDELENLVFSKKNVSQICEVGEKMCEVTIKKTKSKICANPNGNLIFTSMITAFARIRLFEDMQKLTSVGATILYANTDGLFVKCPKNIKLNIELGTSFGQWKHVKENCKIIGFYALSERNYGYLSKDEMGEVHEEIKVAGLSLSNTVDKINMEDYKDLVTCALKNIKKDIAVSQMKNKRHQYTTKKYPNIFTIRNLTKKKRQFICDGLNSVPYGYKENQI